MRVLMLTSVWPTPDHPERAPFIVRQVSFLRKAGVDVEVVHIDGNKNPARYLHVWKHVRGLLARGSYDLIHAQWAQAALCSIPSRIPLVVTFRGSDVEGIIKTNQRDSALGWTLRTISRRVARRANEAILVASRLARLLPPRDYHIIPSGLDLDLFRPIPRDEARARLGLPTEGRLVLFAASPENPIKRYGLAKAAVEGVPCAQLIVACQVAPEKMPLYMNACDALLLTSAHEGSPNVVKEALACNLPVVSTDVGDVRERLANVDGCAVSKSADPRDLADALAAILDRGQRICGRPAVADLHESVLTRKVIDVYERAVAPRAVSAQH